MGILKIFGQGLTTSVRKAKLLALLWPVYFLFSLFVVAPFYALLQGHLSRSLLGENLLTGFDMLWIGDLVYKYQEIPPLMTGWVLGTSLLFLLMAAFLNGGLIGRIAAGEETVTLGNFFGDCGRYFGRFFRVLLISLPVYFLVLGVLGRLVSIPFQAWDKAASSEWTTLTSSTLRLAVFLLLFSVVKMFFDYVKVTLVVDRSRRAVRTTLLNFGFIGRHFFGAWGLFLIVGLIPAVLTLVYLAGAKVLPKTGLGPILLFLWQQMYFVASLWTGILCLATEYHFLKARRPAIDALKDKGLASGSPSGATPAGNLSSTGSGDS